MVVTLENRKRSASDQFVKFVEQYTYWSFDQYIALYQFGSYLCMNNTYLLVISAVSTISVNVQIKVMLHTEDQLYYCDVYRLLLPCQ